jgi:hypothetical protein
MGFRAIAGALTTFSSPTLRIGKLRRTEASDSAQKGCGGWSALVRRPPTPASRPPLSMTPDGRVPSRLCLDTRPGICGVQGQETGNTTRRDWDRLEVPPPKSASSMIDSKVRAELCRGPFLRPSTLLDNQGVPDSIQTTKGRLALCPASLFFFLAIRNWQLAIGQTRSAKSQFHSNRRPEGLCFARVQIEADA